MEKNTMSKYEVVYPLGRRERKTQEQALRPRTLDGLTIGELSNDKFDSDFVFESIEKAILKRIPTAKFVSHERFGNVYGPSESEVIRDLPGNLRRHKVDVVISGMAG
jgi:hypothetical protein